MSFIKVEKTFKGNNPVYTCTDMLGTVAVITLTDGTFNNVSVSWSGTKRTVEDLFGTVLNTMVTSIVEFESESSADKRVKELYEKIRLFHERKVQVLLASHQELVSRYALTDVSIRKALHIFERVTRMAEYGKSPVNRNYIATKTGVSSGVVQRVCNFFYKELLFIPKRTYSNNMLYVRNYPTLAYCKKEITESIELLKPLL